MLRSLFSIILFTLFCTSSILVSAQTAETVDKNAEAASVKSERTTVAATQVKSSAPQPETAAPDVQLSNKSAASSRPFSFVSETTRVGINPAQTAALSLNDAIRRALENNNDIEIARNDVRLNESNLRSLEGIYDPVFTVTPTFTRNSNSRSGGSATNDFSLNLGGSQFFKVGGGRIEPFFNNSRTGQFFNTGSGTTASTVTTATSGSFFSSSLGVSYVQPLLRNRAIDNTRRNIRIQRKRLEQSDADFRRRTIETIAGVQRAYWDLVFALRDQQNRQSNLNLTRENLRRVEAQIEAGAAAPLARAEVATELANRESDLLLSAQNVTTAENILKQLILRDPNAPEWTTQLVPTDEPSFDAPAVKLEDALTEARQNRPELQRLNLQREINNVDVEFFRNQIKPQVDLVSSLTFSGFSQGGTFGGGSSPLFTSQQDLIFFDRLNAVIGRVNATNPTQPPIPAIGNPTIETPATNLNGGVFRSLGNLFSSPSFSTGVTIGFPFRNQSAKADLAGAQIQRTQLDAQSRQQEQTVVAEVRNAVQAVETARQRIMTARTARENAEIQLQGEQKLYEVGRSTTFLLFQRENALANARNAEIRAQTDFNKSLADLQRATSTTLRANNVTVESAVAP